MEAIVAQGLLPEFVANMIGVTFVNIVYYKDSTLVLQYIVNLTIYGLATCMNMCSISWGWGVGRKQTFRSYIYTLYIHK